MTPRHAVSRLIWVFLLSIFSANALAQRDGAGQFSVTTKLKGNLAFFGQDDFDTSRQTWGEQATLFPNFDVMQPSKIGTFTGISGHLGVSYGLPNGHRIGLESGYDCFGEEEIEQGWTYRLDTRYMNSDILGVKFHSVPVRLKYEAPCPKFDRVDLNAEAGVDFWSGRVSYSFESTGAEMSYWERGTFEDSGVRYYVGLGADYEVWKGLKVGLTVGYSIGRLEDFTGTLTNSDGGEREARLTMEPIEAGNTIGHRYLDDPDIGDATPAGLDFSGFRIGVGITYDIVRFGF